MANWKHGAVGHGNAPCLSCLLLPWPMKKKMAASGASPLHVSAIKRTFIACLLPRILLIAPRDWDAVLNQARTTDFDLIERFGIVLGTALTAYLLRLGTEFATSLALPIQYLIQFLSALPILALLVGPFYLRRLRRGLDREVEQRNRVR